MKQVIKKISLLFLTLSFAVIALSSVYAQETPNLVRKIVVFRSNFVNEPAQFALMRKFGGTVIKKLTVINALVVCLPPKAVEALLKSAEVLRIDDDVIVKAIARKPPSLPPAEVLPWGVNRIGAKLAWEKTRGSGIDVGILDTGIDLDHPDLQKNIGGNVNTINPRKSGDDDNGHGTHVAGIVAAVDNDIGVIGVGPDILLHAVKVLDRTGSGWLSDVIEGLQWCMNNGMEVVNMSLGTYSQVQSFHDAIAAAYNNNKGLILVAAAGNDGVSEPLYPAGYDGVIAVAASDANDGIPSWSNWGPNIDKSNWDSNIDLTAPGVDIFSTYKGNSYKTLSGTSMACPHVAATAALVLTTPVSFSDDANSNGKWDPDEVKTKLKATADNLGRDRYHQGAGLVRADLAVE